LDLLSAQLRSETAGLHREVELRLGLPDSLVNLAEYRRCLGRFYGFYRPLEQRLSLFTEWPAVGIDVSEWQHTVDLASDLAVLGEDIELLDIAAENELPSLPDFPHSLGAMYVIAGSSLGSQFMLRYIQTALGSEVAGAEAFFQGRRERTKPLWNHFRSSLDRYGQQHLYDIPHVIEGAAATFGAIGKWMRP